MTITGGTAAAAGLQFQYLVALDCVLSYAETSDSDFAFVTEHETDDAIDYAVTDQSDHYLLVAQAKGAVDPEAASTLSPQDVWSIAWSLIQHDSDRYELRTSRRLSRPADKVLHALVATQSVEDLTKVLSEHHLSDPSLLTESLQKRLLRFQVTSTVESAEVLREKVQAKVSSIRRSEGLGVGKLSSQIHFGYLIATLLQWSARASGRRFTRSDINQLLRVSADDLAGAIGKFDWGLTIGHMPHVDIIARSDLDASIIDVLKGFPEQRCARCVALTGLSGVGKSTLAAAYAQAAQDRYDAILWIDASNPDLIAAFVDQYLPLEHSSLSTSERFRAYLNSSCRYWLVIFDNATCAADLEPWVENIAHADFLATSINRLGWSQWHDIIVPEMTVGEATELVERRMGVASPSADQTVRINNLIEMLDHWPLALELGCAWLLRTQNGLEFSDVYLRSVAELLEQDESLVPEPYRTHRSLWAAVQFSVDEVSRNDKQSLAPQDVLHALAFLPPEQGSLVLAAEIASGVTEKSGLNAYSIDNVVVDLGRASLVKRVPPHQNVPDCVITNSVVLDVVRWSLPDDVQDTYFVQTLTTLEQYAEMIGASLDGRSSSMTGGVGSLNASLIIDSAMYAVTMFPGRMAPAGLILMGNLAMFCALSGKHDLSIALYKRELLWLEATGAEESIIWGETLAGMSQAMMARGDDGDVIVAQLNKAVDVMTPQLISKYHDDAAKLAQRIAHCIKELERTGRIGLDSATATLGRINDNFTDMVTQPQTDLDEIMRLIREGRENEAIDKIDQRLQESLGDLETVTLVAERANALTYAGRYGEALPQWELAITKCAARSLDLAVIAEPVIASWYYVASEAWQGTTSSTSLCLFFEEHFGMLRPPDGDPGIRLRFARLLSLAATGDVNTVSELLKWFEESPEVSSKLPEEGAWFLNRCQAFYALRVAHAGVPLFALKAWVAGHMQDDDGIGGLKFFAVGLTSAAALALRENPNIPIIGQWFSSEAGIGIEVGAPPIALLWAWDREDGSGRIDPAVARLRARTLDAKPAERPDLVILAEAEDTDALQKSEPLAMLRSIF